MITGRLSAKCDVYGFGVTLLKIVRDMSRSKPTPDDKTPPVKWVRIFCMHKLVLHVHHFFFFFGGEHNTSAQTV